MCFRWICARYSQFVLSPQEQALAGSDPSDADPDALCDEAALTALPESVSSQKDLHGHSLCTSIDGPYFPETSVAFAFTGCDRGHVY
jgi:hypothetical protein